MLKKWQKRMINLSILLTFTFLGIYIILSNLRDQIVFFYPPSEINQISFVNLNKKIRVGGIVMHGSVKKQKDKYIFTITDGSSDIRVEYKGILPALFREGQTIIAEGRLKDKASFLASSLLAKHDENYKPPSKYTANTSKVALSKFRDLRFSSRFTTFRYSVFILKFNF